MNHGNYNSHRLDNPLKKSILTESYTNVANQNSHNRSSLSKRPSFTTTSTTSQFSIMT